MAYKLYKDLTLEKREADKLYKREWYKKNKHRFKNYHGRSLEEKRQDYRKNRQKYIAYNYQHKLKINYGLTVDEYNIILETQNGVCAICLEPPTKRRLAVDHNHQTSKVRGLLCGRCNTALGNLRENLIIIDKMVLYIKQHNYGI